KPGAVLRQLQLFATRLTTNRVVVVARFFADEEYGFDFFLALGHPTLLPLLKATAAPAGGQLILGEPELYRAEPPICQSRFFAVSGPRLPLAAEKSWSATHLFSPLSLIIHWPRPCRRPASPPPTGSKL